MCNSVYDTCFLHSLRYLIAVWLAYGRTRSIPFEPPGAKFNPIGSNRAAGAKVDEDKPNLYMKERTNGAMLNEEVMTRCFLGAAATAASAGLAGA